MKFLTLLLGLSIAAAFAGDTAADLQKRFVGSWKLISIDGTPVPNQQPISGKPFGIIMYDQTGHMAVQIVRGERPGFANGAAEATDKERAQAYSTYAAYYGTYTFEPENHRNRLTLSVDNDGKGGRIPFKETTRRLTWEKIPIK
jgi:hypothetical protein